MMMMNYQKQELKKLQKQALNFQKPVMKKRQMLLWKAMGKKIGLHQTHQLKCHQIWNPQSVRQKGLYYQRV